MELLKARVDFRRGGSVSSIELLTDDDKAFFDYAMENELELQLGECNGKHSDVNITLEKNEPDFKFIKLKDAEVEFMKNKLGITFFGDVCFLDEVKRSVFRHLGTKKEVDSEYEFSEWCENERAIKSVSELTDSLISENVEYCKQFDSLD